MPDNPSFVVVTQPRWSRSAFLRGLVVTYRVVRAMFLREVKTKYTQNYLGYLWVVLEPALHLAVLGAIFGFRGKTFGAGFDALVFLFCGVVPMIGFRRVAMSSMVAVKVNMPLLGYPRVRPMDAVLARFTLEAAQSVFVFLVLSIIMTMMGYELAFADPMKVLLGTFALLLMGLGFGMISSIIIHYARDFEDFVRVLMRGLYFSSGIFFLVSQLPYHIQPYVLLNPCLHAIDLVRQGVVGSAYQGVADPTYLFYWTVFLFGFGLFASFSFRHRYYYYYDR